MLPFPCVYIIIERNTVGMSAVIYDDSTTGSDALLCIYGTWPILVIF